MPELERPNNELEHFSATPSANAHNKDPLTTVEHSNKPTILISNCDDSLTFSDEKTSFIDSKVVVDHLSASWTLVS